MKCLVRSYWFQVNCWKWIPLFYLDTHNPLNWEYWKPPYWSLQTYVVLYYALCIQWSAKPIHPNDIPLEIIIGPFVMNCKWFSSLQVKQILEYDANFFSIRIPDFRTIFVKIVYNHNVINFITFWMYWMFDL